ncbi:hypothetical protein OE88DRAFT_1803287 [Heliocybe sulcata]|uniref:Copper homeostasis protein cutC homolog n=1 Tax=Heliocybe sulcata TaxID=5364 RepID=A0A5C3NKE0_9AGAM|nr:hypothetical protein OE88DRAFT_1803287 [Heliocybe sulcata]
MADTESIRLEVCVDSVESAVAAFNGGADRLEVCANLGLGGGTTPSIGLVKAIHQKLTDVPLMVMIRPRVGDFLYTSDELEVMLEDIRQLKATGCVSGFVFGILTTDGRVDASGTKRLVGAASPLQVCFHRAFDMSVDALESYRAVASIPGISRILTSGLKVSTQNPDSMAALQSLLQAWKSDPSAPTVLVGSGVNADTVHSILASLLPFGLAEIHMSGGGWVDSQMTFRREGMGMGVGGEKEWAVWRTSETAVRGVREILALSALNKHNFTEYHVSAKTEARAPYHSN